MPLDPRTPVLVGAGAASQRFDDPADGVEAAQLMRHALDRAASDAGAPALLDRVDEIIVAEGIWGYRDPGRLVLDGRSPAARTTFAAIGVLQQTMFTRAATAIARGDAEVVVVCGGEAKWRSLRAQITGEPASETTQPPDTQPTTRLSPADVILTDIEIVRGLAAPANQYAVMESAERFGNGSPLFDRRPPDEWAGEIATLVSQFSQVAATNPDAWTPTAVTPADVLAAPVVATPYTKPSVSQWNVDQAAAFVLCSAAVADGLGISRDRWVFPHLAVESNHMVPLTQRHELSKPQSIPSCGEELICHDAGADDHELLEIYSCFPIAVRLQASGLEIAGGRTLTVTGGMHFGGGPLNNFSLQALARLVPMLRDRPDARALVTSISGVITKYGAGSWSATPPASAFEAVDITEVVRNATDTVDVDPDYVGRATIAGYTVEHLRGAPSQAVVIADTPDRTRAVATSDDPDVATAMTSGEWCGVEVHLDGPTLRLADTP